MFLSSFLLSISENWDIANRYEEGNNKCVDISIISSAQSGLNVPALVTIVVTEPDRSEHNLEQWILSLKTVNTVYTAVVILNRLHTTQLETLFIANC